jgi:hypothetical protein
LRTRLSARLFTVSRAVCSAALLVCIPVTAAVAAEEHVVPLTELHQRLESAAQKRERDLQDVNRLFSSDQGKKALGIAKIAGDQVKQAVSQLNDEELARLADRARLAESQFAAGALNNQEITYILIALATAVVVLILVH